ncbi:MAG: hypothetical protein LUH03_09705 [Oscillospiraceae bacterium]|nr:hypothetical protein [Oscillospiraceae bacterium]
MQLKKLTRRQKILLSEAGLNPEDYRISWEGVYSLIVTHRKTGDTQVIEKADPKRR